MTGVSVDPIISRLRPRTVAEVLDHAFRLYRKHFLTFIAIIAVVVVPIQLLIQASLIFLVGDMSNIQRDTVSSQISSQQASQIFTTVFVLAGGIFGITLIGSLLQKLSEGALTASVADSHQDRPVTFGTAYGVMFPQAGSLLGLIFLQFLIMLAVFAPIVLVFFLAFGLMFNDSTAGAGGGLICLSCLLFIPAVVGLIYIIIRLLITTPALIVEKLGPMQAIRRSWSLINNYWWRTFAFYLVLYVLGVVVEAGPSSLVSGIVSAFAPRNLVLQQTLSGFITVLTTLIYLPLQLISTTLYYFDLRVRKEGYDLETAMQQRYAPPMPPPGWGGEYGGSYGQPQYGQTQPTGGYAPPQLGGETRPQAYGYDYPQPTTQNFGSDYTQPSPSAPETPRPADTQE